MRLTTWKPTVTTAGKRLIRRFECSNCRFPQIKKTISLVIRCPKCEFPAYDIEFNPQTHELDWYSERKEYWIMHPSAHIEHIKSRSIKGQDSTQVKVKGEKDPMMEASSQIPV